MAAPFVAIFGDIGGYLTNAVIVWFSVLFFYLLLKRYAGQVKALILTVIFAFATLNWFYAASCYSEPLAQLLVMLSFFLLTLEKKHRKWNLIQVLSGIACGLLLFVRPHYILLAVPFFLYRGMTGLKPRKYDRSVLFFAAGVAGVVILWFIRNAVVFGSPLSFEYSRLAGSFTPGMESGGYMKGNIFLGIHRLFFDMYHGLFTITPVFLLFPAGLHRMWNNGLKRESVLILGSAIMLTMFIAAGPYPFTEFGLGSRPLVPLLPLLWFPAVFFLDKTAFTKVIMTVLAVYTFYHAGIGWFTGGEPGMGFYIGILNSSQSRAVLLARKEMLPRKKFSSREEIVKAYRDALIDANMLRFLQTLHPSVIEKIRGHEREFMLNLRSQPDPTVLIDSVDPETGIVMTRFSFSEE